MKKLLSIVTILAVCSSMAVGCGKKDDTASKSNDTKTEQKVSKKASTPKDTIEKAMDSLIALNFDKLADYMVDEDAVSELTEEFDTITSSFTELEDMGMESSDIDNLLTSITGTIEYEILDCEENDDNASVTISLSIPDFDSIDFSDTDLLMEMLGVSSEEELLTKYTDVSSVDELAEMDEDELNDVQADLMSGMMADFAKNMSKIVKDVEMIDEEITFELVKEDGKWLISDSK